MSDSEDETECDQAVSLIYSDTRTCVIDFSVSQRGKITHPGISKNAWKKMSITEKFAHGSVSGAILKGLTFYLNPIIIRKEEFEVDVGIIVTAFDQKCEYPLTHTDERPNRQITIVLNNKVGTIIASLWNALVLRDQGITCPIQVEGIVEISTILLTDPKIDPMQFLTDLKDTTTIAMFYHARNVIAVGMGSSGPELSSTVRDTLLSSLATMLTVNPALGTHDKILLARSTIRSEIKRILDHRLAYESNYVTRICSTFDIYYAKRNVLFEIPVPPPIIPVVPEPNPSFHSGFERTRTQIQLGGGVETQRIEMALVDWVVGDSEVVTSVISAADKVSDFVDSIPNRMIFDVNNSVEQMGRASQRITDVFATVPSDLFSKMGTLITSLSTSADSLNSFSGGVSAFFFDPSTHNNLYLKVHATIDLVIDWLRGAYGSSSSVTTWAADLGLTISRLLYIYGDTTLITTFMKTFGFLKEELANEWRVVYSPSDGSHPITFSDPNQQKSGFQRKEAFGHSLPALLTALVGTIGLSSVPDEKRVRRVLDTMRGFDLIAKISDGAGSLIKAVFEFLPDCIQAWIKDICPIEDYINKWASGGRWEKWYIESNAITLADNQKNILYSTLEQKKVKDLYEEGVQMTKKALTSETKAATSILATVMRKLEATINNVETLKNSMSERPTPFSLYIYGKPGLGKTMSSRQLVDWIVPEGLNDMNKKYIRVAGSQGSSEHWNGYTGQYCVIFDDFGQVQDGADIGEFMIAHGSQPYTLPMASLDDVGVGKKGTVFTSEFILLTSNEMFPRPKILSSIPALWRRRDILVEYVLKLNCRLHGTDLPDKSKLDMVNFTHLEFHIRDPLLEGTPAIAILEKWEDFVMYIHTKNQEHRAKIKTVWATPCNVSLRDKLRAVPYVQLIQSGPVPQYFDWLKKMFEKKVLPQDVIIDLTSELRTIVNDDGCITWDLFDSPKMKELLARVKQLCPEDHMDPDEWFKYMFVDSITVNGKPQVAGEAFFVTKEEFNRARAWGLMQYAEKYIDVLDPLTEEQQHERILHILGQMPPAPDTKPGYTAYERFESSFVDARSRTATALYRHLRKARWVMKKFADDTVRHPSYGPMIKACAVATLASGLVSILISAIGQMVSRKTIAATMDVVHEKSKKMQEELMSGQVKGYSDAIKSFKQPSERVQEARESWTKDRDTIRGSKRNVKHRIESSISPGETLAFQYAKVKEYTQGIQGLALCLGNAVRAEQNIPPVVLKALDYIARTTYTSVNLRNKRYSVEALDSMVKIFANQEQDQEEFNVNVGILLTWLEDLSPEKRTESCKTVVEVIKSLRRNEKVSDSVYAELMKLARFLGILEISQQGVEACQDAQALDLIRGVFSENVFKLDVLDRDSLYGATVRGVVVKGRVALIPRHILYAHTGKLLTDGSTLRLTFQGGSVFEVLFYAKNMRHVQGKTELKDASLVLLPNTVPAKKDITAHFMSDRDSMELDVAYHDGVFLTLIDGMHFVSQNITISRLSKLVEYGDENDKYTVQHGWEHDAQTTVGDCGSLIIVLNSRLPKKIIGLHVSSDPNMNRGTADAITSEMIIATIRSFPQQVEMDVRVNLDADFARSAIAPDGNFTYTDVVHPSRVVRVTAKHEDEPSLIHDQVRVHVTEPSVLTPSDPRIDVSLVGPHHSPLQKGMEKYGFIDIYIEDDLVARVKKHMKHIFASLPAPRLNRVLTENEAINGIPQLEYFDGINMASSAGYPEMLEKPRGAKGKKWMFEGEPGRFTIAKESLRRSVDMRLSEARMGRRVDSIWNGSLKSERRPLAKIAEGKTRVFQVPPTDYVIVMREYFLAFAAYFYENRFMMGSAVGINCESPEWDRMTTILLANAERGIAGDFGNYDGSLKTQFIGICLEIIQDFYNDDDALIREVLFDEIIHTHIQVLNLRLVKHVGNPSGNPMTTVLNTVVNMCYMAYCWMIVAPPEQKDLAFYSKNVCLMAYGDDNILSIKRQALTFYNMVTVTSAMAGLGIEYTDPDKVRGREITPSCLVTDFSFLKRKFYKNNNVWVPQMSMDTIYELTNWTKVGHDPREMLENNAHEALRMTYFYGYTKFKTLRDQIIRACEQSKIKITIVDWDFYHYFYSTKMSLPQVYCDEGNLHVEEEKFRPVFFNKVESRITGRKKPNLYPVLPTAPSVTQSTWSLLGRREKQVMQADTSTLESTTIEKIGGTTMIDQGEYTVVSQPVAAPPRQQEAITDQMWNFKKFLERPTLVGTYMWNQTDAAGTILKIWDAPWEFIMSNINHTAFSMFHYYRGTCILRIQVNATQYHCGRLGIFYVPLLDKETVRAWQGSSMQSSSVMQHCLLDPATSETVEFTIPFQSQLELFDISEGMKATANGDQFIRNHNGIVYVMPFSKLSAATGVSPSVTYTVHVMFRDVELKIPKQDATTGIARLINREVQMVEGQTQSAYYNTSNNFTNSSNNALTDQSEKKTDFGDQKQSAEVSAAVAGPGASATSAQGKGSSATGGSGAGGKAKAKLDKPTNTLEPPMVMRSGVGYMSNAVNVTMMERLSLHPGEMTFTETKTFDTVVDEMSMEWLVTHSSYVTTRAWQSSDPGNTILYTGALCPCEDALFGQWTQYKVFTPSVLDWVSMPFTWWSGGLVFDIDIVTSQFHKGKLYFGVHLGESQVPALMDEATSQYGVYFDIGPGDNKFSFVIPYQAKTMRLQIPHGKVDSNNRTEFLRYAMGTYSLRVVNPLTVTPGISPMVDIMVYKAGMKDYLPRYPTNSNCSIAIDAPIATVSDDLKLGALNMDVRSGGVNTVLQTLARVEEQQMESQIVMAPELTYFPAQGEDCVTNLTDFFKRYTNVGTVYCPVDFMSDSTRLTQSALLADRWGKQENVITTPQQEDMFWIGASDQKRSGFIYPNFVDGAYPFVMHLDVMSLLWPLPDVWADGMPFLVRDSSAFPGTATAAAGNFLFGVPAKERNMDIYRGGCGLLTYFGVAFAGVRGSMRFKFLVNNNDIVGDLRCTATYTPDQRMRVSELAAPRPWVNLLLPASEYYFIEPTLRDLGLHTTGGTRQGDRSMALNLSDKSADYNMFETPFVSRFPFLRVPHLPKYAPKESFSFSPKPSTALGTAVQKGTFLSLLATAPSPQDTYGTVILAVTAAKRLIARPVSAATAGQRACGSITVFMAGGDEFRFGLFLGPPPMRVENRPMWGSDNVAPQTKRP